MTAERDEARRLPLTAQHSNRDAVLTVNGTRAKVSVWDGEEESRYGFSVGLTWSLAPMHARPLLPNGDAGWAGLVRLEGVQC